MATIERDDIEELQDLINRVRTKCTIMAGRVSESERIAANDKFGNQARLADLLSSSDAFTADIEQFASQDSMVNAALRGKDQSCAGEAQKTGDLSPNGRVLRSTERSFASDARASERTPAVERNQLSSQARIVDPNDRSAIVVGPIRQRREPTRQPRPPPAVTMERSTGRQEHCQESPLSFDWT